jgi:hypothetical protein
MGACWLLLSVGATAQPWGVQMPFAWLVDVPLLGHFRTPYRFTIPAVVAIAVAASVALSAARASVGGRWPVLVMTLAALAAWDGVSSRPQGRPFAYQRHTVDAVYHRIAAEQGDGAVLEVPVGVRSGFDDFGSATDLMLHQATHHRPVINAMIARVPMRAFDTYRRNPALRLLAGLDPGAGPSSVDDALLALLTTLNIRYVIVHHERLSATQRRAISLLLVRHPQLQQIADSTSLTAYQITAP